MKRPFDKIVIATVAMAVPIFAIDFIAPLGIGEWMLYLVPLLFTPRSRLAGYPFFYAFFCTVLLGTGMFFPVVPTASHELEMGIIRRLICVSVLWATALFLVQRKRAEAAQRESEERFASFMNHTATIAWMKDENFNFVYVNRPFERFFRTSLPQIKGKNDFELLPENIATELRAHDLQVLASGKNLEINEDVQDRDGRLHHWLVHKFPFKDAEGRKFVGGMAVDVTERKQFEEALRNSQLRFRSVWEGSNDAMRLTDQDGNIVAVNKAF
jgi:PAS domain S-box-containing protein